MRGSQDGKTVRAFGLKLCPLLDAAPAAVNGHKAVTCGALGMGVA